MQKIKSFIDKHWFILIIIVVTLLRIILSSSLPSFYIKNLQYDDKLMIDELTSLSEGNYLGEYNDITLVKGIAFPISLYIANILNVSYSMFFTILYVAASIYFILALKRIIKDKKLLIIIYIFVLFNPVSYSSELFQRLYRNTLSITELLFFFGTIINIIASKKNRSVNYIVLGLITGIMFLTREDNIWTILVYLIIVVYRLYKEFKIRNVIKALIPIIVTVIILNIVCFINYQNYGTYTYNEITNSSFKKAYLKILEIKDDEKKDKVAIPKSTLYKLSENSKVFNMSKEYIDFRYEKLTNRDYPGEIYNGNIIWYLRFFMYERNNLKTGEEANRYFEDLSNEIDELFKEGKLEKEIIIPSVNINTPTWNEIKEFPKNLFDAFLYTTTYENIKSFMVKDLEEKAELEENTNIYKVSYNNYHNAENVIDNNFISFEIIRNIYKYLTIVFSIVALFIYIKNIKIKDKLNLITHIVLLTYLVILFGVTYTHTTAFPAIRYCYLGNVYILQNLFILLNITRVYNKKWGKKDDISNSTSLQ